MNIETLNASAKRAMPCRKSPGRQRRGSSSCSSPPRLRSGEGAGSTIYTREGFCLKIGSIC